MKIYVQGCHEYSPFSSSEKQSLEFHLADLEQVMLTKAEFCWHKLNFAGIRCIHARNCFAFRV